MHSTTAPPLVRCRAEGLDTIDADMLCAPVFLHGDAPDADDDGHNLGPLDLALGGALSRARASGECTGKLHERFLTDVIDTTWRTRRVLLVGAGPLMSHAVAAARNASRTQRVPCPAPRRLIRLGASQSRDTGQGGRP